MILTVLIIIIAILFVTYFVFWPLYKNRPVLLKILPDIWIVYGLHREHIGEALKKASIMGRAEFKEDDNFYILSDHFKIKTISLGKRFFIIPHKQLSNSAKTKLLKTLFKKMMLNYFIAQPRAQ